MKRTIALLMALLVIYRKTENYMARIVLSYLSAPDKNEMKKGIFFE